MGLFLLDDPQFDEHKGPPGHPERPERLTACRRALDTPYVAGPSGVNWKRSAWEPITPRAVTSDEILLVHEASYIEELLRCSGHSGFFDADTFYSEGSVVAARAAAGGALELTDALWRQGGRALALPRPPGHHARPGGAMGFCLLNHVALAAARALELGARRVAIVDWDVHHGNGTEEIFYEDPRVLYISVHQHPLYPGTGALTDVGARDGRGYNLNVPLAAGAGTAVYREVFHQIIEPVLADYQPDLLLVSAGFDAHARDPLANMCLDGAAYAHMMRRLLAAADAVPTAVFLEGGYDLAALEESLAATADVLAGDSGEGDSEAATDRKPGEPAFALAKPKAAEPKAAEPKAAELGGSHGAQVETARRHHAKFWSCL